MRPDTRLDFMAPRRLENEAWIAPVQYSTLHRLIATALEQGDASRGVEGSVLYSPDNKQSWFALATDLTATPCSLDTGGLPGGSNAFVRVLATDGVNTGSSDAGSLTVANKGPIVAIQAPVDQASFAYGENVLFLGEGMDLEEGSLPDSALTWTSSLEGVLGTGRWLERSTLRLGTHVITLTAQDIQGSRGSASVTIVVRPANPLYLPVILSGSR